MKKKLIATVLCAALCVGALGVVAGCGSSSSDSGSSDSSSEARAMNLAIQPSCAFLPLYVARANGWIEDAVKDMDVTVTWTDFESGPPMNESMAAGQQDIAVLGDVPAVSAIAAGQDNVWIAAESAGESYAILVAKDSDIKSVADLKGKKIGVTVGSTGHNLVKTALEGAKVSLDDVELVNIAQGDAQTVLVNKDVDAVALWEPNVTSLVETGEATILTDGKEVGLAGENVVAARKAYVEENEDLVKIYLEQYYRGVQALQDDPKGCCEKIADYLGLDASLLESLLDKYNYSMTFSDTDVAALQQTSDFLVSIDAITDGVDIESHVDDSIVAEVLKESSK